MFEVGMSALVLKICSEYAKSLGFNFPPCTQQEINAICEWVDKHTIKDMTISQNGYNVTFTFKTENDTTKEFTFTIPKAVDIDELEKVLVGSESVVVDRLEDNSGLQVRLDQSVLNLINNKLTKPETPTADSAVTIMSDGTVGTKPLSEIGGGGGKLYRHSVYINYSELTGGVTITIINSSPSLLTSASIETYGVMVGTWAGPEWRGVTTVFNGGTSLIGTLVTLGSDVVYCLKGNYTISEFTDTVTEL